MSGNPLGDLFGTYRSWREQAAMYAASRRCIVVPTWVEVSNGTVRVEVHQPTECATFLDDLEPEHEA